MPIETKVPSLIFYNGRYITPKEAYRCKAISRTMKGRPKKTGICPHCGGTFAINILPRWHNDNCKQKVLPDE